VNLSLCESWPAYAIELGADDAAVIPPATVVTAEWVRMKCLFGCDGPGAYRCCPPNTIPVDQTRRLLDDYRRAVLLAVGPFTGYDDSDTHSRRLNDAATDLERALFLTGFHKALALGAGPCDRCDPCVIDEPCKIPERARPSMEGCGIDVFTTVRNTSWEIDVVRTKEDTYRFFALVLVD
jgi:predicted metal-binding protein